jgi:hypothetical protein
MSSKEEPIFFPNGLGGYSLSQTPQGVTCTFTSEKEREIYLNTTIKEVMLFLLFYFLLFRVSTGGL